MSNSHSIGYMIATLQIRQTYVMHFFDTICLHMTTTIASNLSLYLTFFQSFTDAHLLPFWPLIQTTIALLYRLALLCAWLTIMHRYSICSHVHYSLIQYEHINVIFVPTPATSVNPFAVVLIICTHRLRGCLCECLNFWQLKKRTYAFSRPIYNWAKSNTKNHSSYFFQMLVVPTQALL